MSSIKQRVVDQQKIIRQANAQVRVEQAKLEAIYAECLHEHTFTTSHMGENCQHCRDCGKCGV